MMLSGSRPLLAFFLINQNGVKCFFFMHLPVCIISTEWDIY